MDGPEEQQRLPKGRLYEGALAAQHPEQLRRLLHDDLRIRAWVRDDVQFPFDAHAPFIVYQPMNTRPEIGIALLMGKLAKFSLQLGDGGGFIVVGAPKSGSWIAQEIQRAMIFPDASFGLVSKDPQDSPRGSRISEVPILSYAHGRAPDGTRRPQTMFFHEPGDYEGKNVLLFDDVIAEGETVIGMAAAMRGFGAASVSVVVALFKEMQGGRARIEDSSLIEHLVVGARVLAVGGPGIAQLVLE